jgi:hypothetical protein
MPILRNTNVWLLTCKTIEHHGPSIFSSFIKRLGVRTSDPVQFSLLCSDPGCTSLIKKKNKFYITLIMRGGRWRWRLGAAHGDRTHMTPNLLLFLEKNRIMLFILKK